MNTNEREREPMSAERQGKRSESPAPVYSESQLCEFLFQLTVLSKKYGLGIAGKPVLFVLEGDDNKRVYSANAESELSYE